MPSRDQSGNTQIFSMSEGFILVERSIWTEQQVGGATACITLLKGVHGMRDPDLAMAAIDAAQCKAPDITLADLLLAQQHQSEPIRLTAVATLEEDGDGGLEPNWLLEGGTAELFAGMTLLVADNAPHLCDDDGSAQVYTHADPAEALNDLEDAKEACAEIERTGTSGDVIRGMNDEMVDTRAQLAEAQALLREIADHCNGYVMPTEHLLRDWGSSIDAALSASAEPEVRP